jgi:hypothetical protein
MIAYNKYELEEAIKSISSTLSKCEKAFEKLKEGTSQHTLMKRRIKSFHISLELIKKELLNLSV